MKKTKKEYKTRKELLLRWTDYEFQLEIDVIAKNACTVASVQIVAGNQTSWCDAMAPGHAPGHASWRKGKGEGKGKGDGNGKYESNGKDKHEGDTSAKGKGNLQKLYVVA